jgi:serine/threonine protein kinase
MYTQLGLMHCDISSENVMWDPKENCGILNDFDLAKLVNEMPYIPVAERKAGTLPFIASDLLTSACVTPLFQHELESFLCVIMWIVGRFENGEQKFCKILSTWLCGNRHTVYLEKSKLFTNSNALDQIPWKQSKTYQTIFDTWIYPLSRALLKLNDQKATAMVHSGVSEKHVTEFQELFMRTIRG